MVDQQKIVVTTTLLFSFYALAFGRFFSILDQQNIRGKMIRNRGWDKTAQTKGVEAEEVL